MSQTPPSSRASSAGGTNPMMKPMFGMKLVMKASTPHTKAPGTPISWSAMVSITATIRPKIAETAKYVRVPWEKVDSDSATRE